MAAQPQGTGCGAAGPERDAFSFLRIACGWLGDLKSIVYEIGTNVYGSGRAVYNLVTVCGIESTRNSESIPRRFSQQKIGLYLKTNPYQNRDIVFQ